jgi:hypothetical protein
MQPVANEVFQIACKKKKVFDSSGSDKATAESRKERDTSQSAKDSKCLSRYVLALWLRAPIETAKYSKDVPLGENSYRWGPV